MALRNGVADVNGRAGQARGALASRAVCRAVRTARSACIVVMGSEKWWNDE